MRFADIAIDVAALLSASRSVAAKHVALRSRQLDRYNKSSSIAATLRQRQHGSARSAPPAQEQPSGAHDGIPAADAAKPAQPTTSGPAVDEPPPVRDAARQSLPRTDILSQPFSAQSNILRELRRREYATPESRTKAQRGPAVATTAKPHPLDPRFNQHTDSKEVPAANEVADDGDEVMDAVPEGVNINVFRTSRVSKMMETSSQPPEDPEESRPNVAARQKGTETMEDHPTVTPPTSNQARQNTNAHEQVRILKEESIPAAGCPAIRPAAVEPDSRDTAPEAQLGDPRNLPNHISDYPTDQVKSQSTDGKEPKVTAEEASVLGEIVGDIRQPAYQLRESKVPSSRLGRLWNYGGLAAGMLGGALSESISRGFGGGGQGSVMLSAANMERLVSKLSRMRGAALKLGQMMSFQDSKMLPVAIQEVLQRVQDRADYMPSWQRDRVLTKNLGSDWRNLFDTFEERPMAAASIGQVHRATLKSTGAEVAVKIQFPGVAESINSDLDNLAILLAATKLLPKGLYLDKTIDNARTELAWECDYEREAECGQRYRDLLTDEKDVFLVPKIHPEACGKQVLTMEYMEGIGVTRVKSFTQEQRDWIGTQILRLCLREITEFKFMQTDPNWTNFLYNAKQNKLELLDFGASREYPDRFIALYVQLLHAASKSNKDSVRDLSTELGYLTGHESKAMLEAHTQSVLTLAEPFLESAPVVYDFRDQSITERVKALIPVMIRERLAPPPEETYSLHRKLSGAFLLCARLGSRVRCREMFEKSLRKTDLMFK